jgi:SAM-dependent methyltransferase
VIEKTMLHFGCGGFKLPGWQNFDRELDITQPLPFADNSVDFIFSEHVIEHVTIQQAWTYFEECRRVLKPGGIVRTNFPNIVQTWRTQTPDYKNFVTSSGWGEPCIRHLVFNHGHQALWTPDLMITVLWAVGYANAISTFPLYSDHLELVGIEQHWRSIGEACNLVETAVVEGTK